MSAFEIRPYPDFSWSMSRQRKLERCPRAYFYGYYLSHNGWLDDAPPESRMAYRLNKLTSLDALLGQQMDERARELEAAARSGKPLPTAAVLEQRTRAALRQAWRTSKSGRAAFEHKPGKVVMLRALYLEQNTQPEVDRLNEKAGPCMAGLLATSHWERLCACGDAGRIEIPAFASFQHDGLKVFAAPDMAYVHEGTLHVIDWKSGREDDTNPMQVLLQVWWARATHPALEGLALRGHIEYVAAGRTEPVDPAPDFKAEAARTVREGVARMRALTRDPRRNIPLEMEAFEKRASGLCRTCDFAPICE
ncbi:MAG: PD-(D/E)XK nuclease family protein [Actinomycetes bacterium]